MLGLVAAAMGIAVSRCPPAESTNHTVFSPRAWKAMRQWPLASAAMAGLVVGATSSPLPAILLFASVSAICHRNPSLAWMAIWKPPPDSAVMAGLESGHIDWARWAWMPLESTVHSRRSVLWKAIRHFPALFAVMAGLVPG